MSKQKTGFLRPDVKAKLTGAVTDRVITDDVETRLNTAYQYLEERLQNVQAGISIAAEAKSFELAEMNDVLKQVNDDYEERFITIYDDLKRSFHVSKIMEAQMLGLKKQQAIISVLSYLALIASVVSLITFFFKV